MLLARCNCVCAGVLMCVTETAFCHPVMSTFLLRLKGIEQKGSRCLPEWCPNPPELGLLLLRPER